MKILQVICTLGTGGAEKLLLDTVVLYKKAGIEMDVLVLWDNDFPFAKALQELNCCKLFVLKKSKRYNDIYNPASILKIRKILKEHKYDIVHVHLFPPQYYVLLANMLNRSKVKLVFTEHNTSNTRIANQIFKSIERFVYNKYDRIICITEEIREIYKNYLGCSDKLITINNGVDLNKIQSALPYSKYDLGYSDEDKLLIMVAGFRIQKDQETLIKSLLHLPKIYKLILVGDGVRKGDVEKLVKELNLDDRVNFLGVRSDVYSLIKACDIAVLSSHWEGFGLAAAEAMACGVPTIASNVDGLSQVVEGAGILFEKRNAKQLAEKIVFLMNDEGIYRSVADKCRERSKMYDISKMVSKHVELYQSLLNEE